MRAEQLVAHRGYRARAPENTRSAIIAAIEAGALFVEIDIQFSADCQPVIYHDACMGRVSGIEHADRMVVDHRVDELVRLPASESERFGVAFEAEKIVTLDILNDILFRHPEVHVFLEIKTASLVRFDRQMLIDALEPYRLQLQKQLVIISADYPLIALAAKANWQRTGVVLNDWMDLQGQQIKGILPDYVFIDKVALPESSALDKIASTTVVYEVGDIGEARALIAAGADLVETFDIGKLLSAS